MKRNLTAFQYKQKLHHTDNLQSVCGPQASENKGAVSWKDDLKKKG